MVLPDSGALVLEQLSGKPLAVILKREANRFLGPLRRGRMAALGRLTGYWLNQLHEATRTEPLRHDSALFLADIEDRFGRCRGVRQEAIDRLMRRISRASHQIHGHPIPAAARQGDFIPQNILVDENLVRVVDFESFSRSESIYDDVATFVTYIRALSAFPYYSQPALRALADSFLQAYGVTGDERPFRLYLARALVVLISEMNLQRAALYAPKRLRLLQAQLERVCAELPRTASAA